MSHQNCRIKSAVILYLQSSSPGFTRSLVLCVMFSRSLFVVLYVFFWPLCCLFFSELRFRLPLWYLQALLTCTVLKTINVLLQKSYYVYWWLTVFNLH